VVVTGLRVAAVRVYVVVRKAVNQDDPKTEKDLSTSRSLKSVQREGPGQVRSQMGNIGNVGVTKQV
jgi:hypothetical protein